jgi:hypothetical protein
LPLSSAFAAQVNTTEFLRFLRTVRVSVSALVTVSITTLLQKLGKSSEHQLITLRDDIPISLDTGRILDVPLFCI